MKNYNRHSWPVIAFILLLLCVGVLGLSLNLIENFKDEINGFNFEQNDEGNKEQDDNSNDEDDDYYVDPDGDGDYIPILPL